MNEAQFDQALASTFSHYADIQAQALSVYSETQTAANPVHTFSRRFSRRMARLLNNPQSYARNSARPVWQRALRTAAMVLISLSLTGAVLLSIPQVRAAVWKFIRIVYETNTEYRFTDPAPEDTVQLPTYHANWLPEGYEETYMRNTGSDVLIHYENSDSVIRFTYNFASQGTSYSIDNEHTEETILTVNKTVYTIHSNEQTGWHGIFWFSDDHSIFHQLSGYCSINDLLKIKDNLIEK